MTENDSPKTAIGRSAKANSTEWTAAFLVAAELTRRRYTVSFTMGNRTPIADLLAGDEATGHQFWIDVKGIAQKRRTQDAWFFTEKKPLENLFYVFVSVALPYTINARPEDRFYVLSQQEANEINREHRSSHSTYLRMPGPSLRKEWEEFEDRWDKLRRPIGSDRLLQSN